MKRSIFFTAACTVLGVLVILSVGSPELGTSTSEIATKMALFAQGTAVSLATTFAVIAIIFVLAGLAVLVAYKLPDKLNGSTARDKSLDYIARRSETNGKWRANRFSDHKKM